MTARVHAWLTDTHEARKWERKDVMAETGNIPKRRGEETEGSNNRMAVYWLHMLISFHMFVFPIRKNVRQGARILLVEQLLHTLLLF